MRHLTVNAKWIWSAQRIVDATKVALADNSAGLVWQQSGRPDEHWESQEPGIVPYVFYLWLQVLKWQNVRFVLINSRLLNVYAYVSFENASQSAMKWIMDKCDDFATIFVWQLALEIWILWWSPSLKPPCSFGATWVNKRKRSGFLRAVIYLR